MQSISSAVGTARDTLATQLLYLPPSIVHVCVHSGIQSDNRAKLTQTQITNHESRITETHNCLGQAAYSQKMRLMHSREQNAVAGSL